MERKVSDNISFRSLKSEWDVYFDMIKEVKDIFDANQIEVPYNQLDVHLYNEK